MKIQSMLLTTLFLISIGCYSLKRIKPVNFIFYEGASQRKMKIKIPQWMSIIKIKADAESGTENQYWYKDSSVFYITDKNGTINNFSIRKQNDSYSKEFMSDSISLSGIDEKGNCWREIKYRSLFYGYANVHLINKSIFDDALNLIKIK